MPLKPHPTDPDKVIYVRRQYNLPKAWVGLTDEECLQNPYCAGENDVEVLQLARAIEAKLKEKNT